MIAAIALRDIHQPPAPPWWPPAPGWWLVFGALLLCAGAWWAWHRRRLRRRRRIEAVFDDALAAAASPADAVARISELLRRAARTRDPRADRLQGADWIAFLDRDVKATPLDAEQAALLLDGGFRREVDPAQADALARAARVRFLAWMGVR